MTAIVFSGPTLAGTDPREGPDVVYLPPASAGDVYRAALERPTVIGLIDGYFESVPSVWHKEILFALSQGIHVIGAASMGALRAAELQSFGMEGVGAVFRAFVTGELEDDDEVAVAHAPREFGYVPLSEAMVNIRRTLSDALASKVIGLETRSRFESAAKASPFPERSFATMINGAEKLGVPREDVARFLRWLPQGRVDQKRDDALLLLRRIRHLLHGVDTLPARVPFHFFESIYWKRIAKAGEAPSPI